MARNADAHGQESSGQKFANEILEEVVNGSTAVAINPISQGPSHGVEPGTEGVIKGVHNESVYVQFDGDVLPTRCNQSDINVR